MPKFSQGGMWDEAEWEIRLDARCSKGGGVTPCKHCSSSYIVQHREHNHWDETVWTCPRVVVGTNEGGYNSTGICLDCILEAASTLPALPEQESAQ